MIIKPDGVRQGLIGEILGRFERKGLKVAEMKLMRVSLELAGQLYDIHQGKDFFDSLVAFITSGDVVVMVLEGDGAIAHVRSMIGPTDPRDAAPGSIRGDFAVDIGENIVHAADSPERAAKEAALFFSPS